MSGSEMYWPAWQRQKSAWVNGAGSFDYDRWKAAIDKAGESAGHGMVHAINDSTAFGHYVIDEPQEPLVWRVEEEAIWEAEARLRARWNAGVRRRWRRRVCLAAALVLALAFLASVAHAQAPAPKPFLVIVDTLGISEMVTLEGPDGAKVPTAHPGIYITWVKAALSPTAQPASMILVAWDCKQHLVKRISQIVYRMRPDSLGVDAVPSEPSAGMSAWQAPTYPDLFAQVCRIGPTHAPALSNPTHPTNPKPQPLPGPAPDLHTVQS